MTTEQAWAKRVGETLFNAYPGYRWAVTVTGGLARIRNLDLSGIWGFDLHLSRLKHDPLLEEVVMAGGEILERYHLRRGAADPDLINTLPREWTGEAKGDLE